MQPRLDLVDMPMARRPTAAIVLLAVFLHLTSHTIDSSSSSSAVEWCDAHCVDASDAAGQTPHTDITPPSAKFTVIVGCQKCGTTFLYGWLSRHPSVAYASKNAGIRHTKELHYLDRKVGSLSHQVYMSFWGHREQEELSSKYMFEASPSYVLAPCAACR